MSDKIVTLISSQNKKPEEKKPAREANPELVQMAEEILARAKSGELAALAVAEVIWTDTGATNTNGSFLYVSGTAFAMMYALERLVHRIKEKAFG